MSARVHAFRVSWPIGGYRSFKSFDTFNAYLRALEDSGVRWEMLDETTVRVLA